MSEWIGNLVDNAVRFVHGRARPRARQLERFSRRPRRRAPPAPARREKSTPEV